MMFLWIKLHTLTNINFMNSRHRLSGTVGMGADGVTACAQNGYPWASDKGMIWHFEGAFRFGHIYLRSQREVQERPFDAIGTVQSLVPEEKPFGICLQRELVRHIDIGVHPPTDVKVCKDK